MILKSYYFIQTNLQLLPLKSGSISFLADSGQWLWYLRLYKSFEVHISDSGYWCWALVCWWKEPTLKYCDESAKFYSIIQTVFIVRSVNIKRDPNKAKNWTFPNSIFQKILIVVGDVSFYYTMVGDEFCNLSDYWPGHMVVLTKLQLDMKENLRSVNTLVQFDLFHFLAIAFSNISFLFIFFYMASSGLSILSTRSDLKCIQ